MKKLRFSKNMIQFYFKVTDTNRIAPKFLPIGLDLNIALELDVPEDETLNAVDELESELHTLFSGEIIFISEGDEDIARIKNGSSDIAKAIIGSEDTVYIRKNNSSNLLAIEDLVEKFILLKSSSVRRCIVMAQFNQLKFS